MHITELTPARINKLSNFNILPAETPERIRFLWFDFVHSDDNAIYSYTHTHSFFEIIFIFSGKATHEYKNEKIVLFENEALIIPPNTPHKLITEGNDYLRCSFALSFEENSVLQSLILKSKYVKFSVCDNIIENINLILKETDNNDLFAPTLISNRLNEILYSVLRTLKIDMPEYIVQKTDSRFNVAIEFIKNNKNRLISCEDIAKECCLSSKQLNRIFKKHTNNTLNNYLIEARINYAKTLILQKGYSIKEIGYMLGFENTCGFVSFFKRHSGITPSEYRALSSKKIISKE